MNITTFMQEIANKPQSFMMSKYKIVKETNSYTNISQYYVYKKVKFLFWFWWKMEKINYGFDVKFALKFDTFKDAKEYVDKSLSYNKLETIIEI